MIEASVRDEMTQYMHRSLRELQNIYEAQMREEVGQKPKWMSMLTSRLTRMTSLSIARLTCSSALRRTQGPRRAAPLGVTRRPRSGRAHPAVHASR